MTPRQEADDAVQQFAALVAQSGQETTGIPRPATVESSETSLDPSPFALELDPQTTAQAFPGGGPGTGTPPGACCIAGVCSIKYAAACATAGGTYLGDGTPCPPSSVSLTCDSISASKSKCGFRGLLDGSGFYLTQVCSYHDDCVCCSTAGTHPCVGRSGTTTYTYDPDACTFSNDGIGYPAITTCLGGTVSGGLVGPASGAGGFIAPFFGGSITDNTQTHLRRESSPDDFHCDGTTHGAIEWSEATLSVEYTTADLISNTEAALPSYPGTFAGSCSASRDLATDESSYTISRFKPKFTIPMALDDDLIICYNEHFVPDDGGDPVDTPQTVTIPGGDTEVEGDEVMEPDTDGEITITDITTCCTG